MIAVALPLMTAFGVGVAGELDRDPVPRDHGQSSTRRG
jgi:hypothetical protein